MSPLRRALQVLAFPGVLFGGTGIALVVLGRGTSATVLFPALLASVMVAIALLERLLPYHEAWNRSHGDIVVDVIHNIVSGFLTVESARALLLLAFVPAASLLSQTLDTSLWPAWPLAAQLALALVVSEPLQYCAHRLAHERVEWLWSWHAVHHSAQRLYWLNTVRDHPFGILVQFSCQFLPLLLLGCPERTIQLWALFSAVHGMLQHSNIDMRLGPFRWIFSTADLHRWHHSPRLDETNHNYGALLIYCDLLGGSYLLPPRKAPVHPGIGDLPGFPQGYLAQLAVPFRWKRIKANLEARVDAQDVTDDIPGTTSEGDTKEVGSGGWGPTFRK